VSAGGHRGTIGGPRTLQNGRGAGRHARPTGSCATNSPCASRSTTAEPQTPQRRQTARPSCPRRRTDRSPPQTKQAPWISRSGRASGVWSGLWRRALMPRSPARRPWCDRRAREGLRPRAAPSLRGRPGRRPMEERRGPSAPLRRFVIGRPVPRGVGDASSRHAGLRQDPALQHDPATEEEEELEEIFHGQAWEPHRPGRVRGSRPPGGQREHVHCAACARSGRTLTGHRASPGTVRCLRHRQLRSA